MEDHASTTRRPPLLPTLALAGLLLLPLAACGGDTAETAAPEDTGATTEAAADDVQTYQVRGQITGLPDDAVSQANLIIRHEAIDDFVSMNGEVVGMSSMSMPFPVADDVDLDAREVGDKVRFTLVVDWDGDPAYQVTRMEALPEDTEIEYRKARPGGEDEAGGQDGDVEHEGMGMDGEMDHEGMGHEGVDHEGDASGS